MRTSVGSDTPTGYPVELKAVKFDNQQSQSFVADIKSRVNAYFDENQLSRKANGAMIAKTVMMFALTFIPYALILTNRFSPWEMLGLAVLMGIGMAGIGFSISHDALHGAYSSNQKVNTILGMTFDLLGANGYMWKITHNVIHHTYTNIQGIDEDLEVSPLLRLSPESEHKPIHRWQHIYGLAAYSMSTLNWVFAKDFIYLLRNNLGPYQNVKHPPKEVAILIGMKIVFYLYTIIVPLLVLDIALWQFAIGYLAMHMTAGFILGVVFQLAHVVEGPEHFTSKNGDTMEDAWLVHEMKTTANFGRRNKLLCWYVGGLNFQIEHHLFPKVCSIHYPAISPIVEQVAKEHGIPYHQHTTLMEAVASHLRMLKTLGRPETMPAPVPVSVSA